MPKAEVTEYTFPQGWNDPARSDELSRKYCEALEDGDIVVFPANPFEFSKDDREFLLSQKQSGLKVHKNVSYRPSQDLLRGDACETPEENQRLHDIMRRYSREVTRFLTQFLAPYASHWTLDFASYRPLEEKGRDLPLHKRNDLMHVDAFPSRIGCGCRADRSGRYDLGGEAAAEAAEAVAIEQVGSRVLAERQDERPLASAKGYIQG